MINENCEIKVTEPFSTLQFTQLAEFEKNFVLTDRERSFAALPQKVLALLREGKHVALIQLDGLGIDQTQSAINDGNPLFTLLRRIGSLEQWSAQWPATTTVQMTTLYSGLPVERHGLLEWVVWDPKSDMLISPLPFSGAREKERNTLLQKNIRPEDIFPKGELSAQIKSEGFEMVLIGREEYLISPMSQVVCPEARLAPAESIEESARLFIDHLTQASRPSFMVLYTDLIDKVNHGFSKESAEAKAVLQNVTAALYEKLIPGLASIATDFVLIVTSDHGHMTVNKNEPLYINHLIPDIEKYLLKRKNGEVIPCSGGYRSLFLHAIPEEREILIERLQEKLVGRASVFKFETLLDIGVFDRTLCSDEFYSRAGNVCILPYQGETVYFHIPGVFEMTRASIHGGASPEEMRTPFFEVTKQQFDEYLKVANGSDY